MYNSEITDAHMGWKFQGAFFHAAFFLKILNVNLLWKIPKIHSFFLVLLYFYLKQFPWAILVFFPPIKKNTFQVPSLPWCTTTSLCLRIITWPSPSNSSRTRTTTSSSTSTRSSDRLWEKWSLIWWD